VKTSCLFHILAGVIFVIMKPQKKTKESTSQYRGVYFDTSMGKWVIYLEKHENHPSFNVEYDAGIYAEYYLRQIYGERYNFPSIDDGLLNRLFELVMTMHSIEIAENRSTGLQGVKRKGTSSKYVGVYKKRDTHWGAVIHYKGKRINLGSFNMSDPKAEENAAMAYDEKALELYGKKARLNFPE